MPDSEAVKIHPAATIILLRPAPSGFEVLLLLRHQAIKFAGDTWVFPGGRIEAEDANNGDRFTLEAARAAAVRECDEEAGVKLTPESMIYYSHWTTPSNYHKRFATWFLLDAISPEQTITIDDREIVEYRWLTPQTAIAERHAGHLKMMPPTYRSLLELERCNSVEEALAFARNREAPVITPLSAKYKDLSCLLYEEDIAYESGDLTLTGPQHRIVFNDTDWDYVKSQ